MFEPFQDRNPHFFGTVSLSWFIMKSISKTYSGDFKSNFFKNPNFAPKNFSWVVWSKTNWSYTFSKWISWQISSNWLFQRNVDSDLEKAQTSEPCYNCVLGCLAVWMYGCVQESQAVSKSVYLISGVSRCVHECLAVSKTLKLCQEVYICVQE